MKKNFKLGLREIWLVIGVFSMIALFLPRADGWQEFMKNTLLVLNALMFLLSLPCSLFAVPVMVAAAYYLDMPPASSRGMTLSTILLFVIGLMQWFWIARFWSPTEPPFQMLDLLGDKSDMTAFGNQQD
ncbi:MAG TPA: hypothetical protein VK400_00575 [Pyrinomonadaceae bacterium]|nr:hypothetical protein [Pyrinomonadaceae bacterium]